MWAGRSGTGMLHDLSLLLLLFAWIGLGHGSIFPFGFSCLDTLLQTGMAYIDFFFAFGYLDMVNHATMYITITI